MSTNIPILTYLTDTYTLERVTVSVRNDEYRTRVDYTLERQVGSPFVLITCDDDDQFAEDTVVHGDLAAFQRVAETWVRNFHEREYGA